MSKYPGRLERAFDESLDYEVRLKKQVQKLEADLRERTKSCETLCQDYAEQERIIEHLATELAFYRHQSTGVIVDVPTLIKRAKGEEA